MTVDLHPNLPEIIQRKVDSGRYQSAGEVVCEALQLLEERDQIQELRLKKLRDEIDVGLEQARRGEVVSFDDELVEEIKREGRCRLADIGRPVEE